MKKIVSIGCGGAGMFSGIVASQLRKGAFEAIALADESDIYCRCTTPYILTNEAHLADAIQPDSMASDYGVKVIHEKAVKINTDTQEVHTDKGNIFLYDELVIATGSSPVKLTIPGIDGAHIFTVRTSKDTENIQKYITTAKSAVVVGAGVIGIEMAGALKKCGLDVNLVEYQSSLSSAIADKEFAEKIVGLLHKNNVATFFGYSVIEIKEDVVGKKEVVIRNNNEDKSLFADIVIIAVGVKPNLDIIAGTDIESTKRGIVVDKRMRTNIPHIYACGDCAIPLSAVTGDYEPSALASSAIQQAKIVGFQIAGFPIAYNGSTRAFAFQTLGREYAGVGLTETEARKKFRWVVTGTASTTDVYKDLIRAKDLQVKLIFAGPKMRLVGYEAFGTGVIASAELASFVIGLRLSILSLMKFNYISHPSMTPWPFMNPMIMASEEAMGKIMEKIQGLLKWWK